MRIALIDATKKHTYYPFGLLRIGAYLKDIGNDVKLFYKELPNPETCEYDEYWISAIFTFEIPYVKSLIRAYAKHGVVRVGGVSPTIMPDAFRNEPCIVQPGKYEFAERYPLDYSLLGFEPEYSMSKITDGCVRKCPFCVVHKIEPKFIERQRWKDDILPTTKYVVFSDNNYTVRPLDKMRADIEYFQWMRENTSNRHIDFNQALDCRLITPERADLLGQLPIAPVRFSYDGHQEDGYIETAIERMAEHGKRSFTIYVLYNFDDEIAYLWERLRVLTELGQRLNVSVTAFPMRYQPIDVYDTNREYVGKHWDVMARKNFMCALNQFGPTGGLSFSDLDMFKYWLGETADEFVAMMHYPKARQLFARKKEQIRKARCANKCSKE